jgi:hypothetical protein
MRLLLLWLPIAAIIPIGPDEVKVSIQHREFTIVSNREVPTSIRGQTETTRCTHTKKDDLLTPATRAGGVTLTRCAHAA